MYKKSFFQNWQTLSQIYQEKREKNQINKIKNEKGEVTKDNAGIQRIIRNYYKQLYGNKIDNLEEMDRFLEMFNLLKLKKEEIEIINNPITSIETGAVILTKKKKKNFQKTKAEDQMASQEYPIKHLEKS